jgi:acyl-coenzyme A synthetase/AMP-(fatty) acid ligase
MLILKRRYEFWFCLLALHKIGAAAVPATHLLTKKDIVYRNNAASIKMIVAVGDEQVLKSIDESAPASETLALKAYVDTGCHVPKDLDSTWIDFNAARAKEDGEFPLPAPAERPTLDDTSLLYFTSGTTGHPKMVQHDFAYPLGHIVTAKYWQNVINDGLHLTVAGEPLNAEVYNQFKEITGIKLMEGYGQTELTLAAGCFTGMEPKPGSMGKPSPGYHIAVMDKDGKPCPTGDVGQIVIMMDKFKPVGLFKGYYRDEKLTESVYHDGIYYTGDTAWMDEDGFLWFVGRTDDVIKSSGYRIGPFEVESALIEHESVLECAVTAVPDEMRGQIVKATIVLSPDWKEKKGDTLVKELQNHVKKVTAPYKYPRIIEFVEELPKTISGKIRRVEIRGEE